MSANNGAPSRDEGIGVLVMIGARLIVGVAGTFAYEAWKPGDPIELHSPYDYHGAIMIQRSATERDGVDIGMQKGCTAIGGLASLRRLTVRPDALERIDALSKRDAAGIAEAIAKCEAIMQGIRREMGGIAGPRLVLPGS